jgi:hypothetical protein
MHRALLLAGLVWLSALVPAAAQRRVRLGLMGSSISLEDLSGSAHGFNSFGASVALISGDDGETGLSVARYHDLSTDNRVRRLTLWSLDSYYYPVGTRGLAPFAATELGLARVTESASTCVPLLSCRDTVSTTSQFALGFGLGLRANLGDGGVAMLEGRFLEIPGSSIQALEVRATAALALGSPYTGQFLAGTVGPALGVWIPISGPLRGRGPLVGARFRRDTKTSGSVGLEIDFAPLQVTTSCSPPGCQPNAILFAPGYEASVRPSWGRLYAEAGLLVAGFYQQGPNRGVAQGLHGGVGVDLDAGQALWNLNARLLVLQRSSQDNVFAVQLGASLSPRLGPSRPSPRAGAPGH